MRGKQGQAVAGEGACVPANEGTLQLHVMVSGHHWGGNGALRYCLLENKFSLMITRSLWNGAPRQVKCSLAAWVSLCWELMGRSEQAGGASGSAGIRAGLPRDLPHPAWFYRLSTVESKAPIHAFFQRTNQSIIHIHTRTNCAPLQVMHRENNQSL